MTSFGGIIAKLVICFLNLFFILLSLTIALLGINIYTVRDHQLLFLDESFYRTLSIVFIVVGTTLFIISLIGFIAVLCESSFILNAYIYFLALCSAAMLAIFIGSLVYSDKAAKNSSDQFGQMMSNFSIQGHYKYEMVIVQMWQSTAYCCGNKASTDWHNFTLMGYNAIPLAKENLLPISCCGKSISLDSLKFNSNVSSASEVCNATSIQYRDGCFSDVQVKRYKWLSNGFFLALFIIVLFLLVITCCLERDRQLQSSQIVNLQYASHLNTCTSDLPSASCPQPDDTYFLHPLTGTSHHGVSNFQGATGPPKAPPAYGNISADRFY